MWRLLAVVSAGLLELVLPEHCQLCNAGCGDVPWTAVGPRVAGLRPWDRPHLCATCARALATSPCLRTLQTAAEVGLPAVAGRLTCEELVRLVGALKYHGVRGLAWPLAALAATALPAAIAQGGTVDALVAIPLHRRRRRRRGFNQAELLARLLARQLGLPCLDDIVQRRRATAQQARLAPHLEARLGNVAGAFSARRPGPGEGPRLGLVDDLITSGATALAASAALVSADWDVRWVLALGLSAPSGAQTPLDSLAAPT
jgi:predicted amidophosphoribosyltransferase